MDEREIFVCMDIRPISFQFMCSVFSLQELGKRHLMDG